MSATSLPALLASWQQTRDPALADAIDLLARAVRVEPLTGTVAERIASFHALLASAEAEPLDLTRALLGFPIGTIGEAAAQLEALAELDDPRISARLLALLDDPPLRSPAALDWWKAALAIVEGLRDARAIARLDHHRRRVEGEFAAPMGRLVKREIEDTLERVKASAGAIEAAPASRELLASLRKKHASDGRDEDLLALIHADPSSDEARWVYADHLMERGDPRGEFIALSLATERGDASKDQQKRLRALTKQYAVEWLGPLAPVVNKTGLGYRRGFVDTIVLKAKNQAQVEKLIGDPAWSTVRSITMDSHWPFQAFVDRLILDPALRSLREIAGYSSPALFLALTLSDEPRPLTSLTFNQLGTSYRGGWSIGRGWAEVPPEGPGINPKHRRALTACPGLPMLRRLELSSFTRVPAEHMRWLFDGELGQRLERLTTDQHEPFIGGYLEALADHPLAELELRGAERTQMLFTRGESGRLDQLDAKFKSTNRPPYDATPLPGAFELFLTMLEGLPADGLAHMTLRWPKKKAPTSEQLDRLAQIVESRPGLVARYP